MSQLFQILAIDGGGIRGIIPATVLVEVERILRSITGNPGAHIADHFDMIAGTSTGGILACAHLCPSRDNPRRPRYDAQRCLDLYFERGDEIFDIPVWHRTKSAGGVLDEKYPADGLEEALEDYLGDLRLSELLKPCLITAYDIKRREARFFTQHNASQPERDFLVRDVARATSAAPTFFECARVKSAMDLVYPLIDGGIFVNNPSMCAYAEAHAFFKKRAAEMAVLALGTGSFEKSYAWQEAKDWGLAGWVKPIIEIMMSAVSETVDYQMQQLFSAAGAPDQYLRIQPELPARLGEMDNAEPENMAELRQAGLDVSLAMKARLEAFLVQVA